MVAGFTDPMVRVGMAISDLGDATRACREEPESTTAREELMACRVEFEEAVLMWRDVVEAVALEGPVEKPEA